MMPFESATASPFGRIDRDHHLADLAHAGRAEMRRAISRAETQ
jgi:hypothetical protein